MLADNTEIIPELSGLDVNQFLHTMGHGIPGTPSVKADFSIYLDSEDIPTQHATTLTLKEPQTPVVIRKALENSTFKRPPTPKYNTALHQLWQVSRKPADNNFKVPLPVTPRYKTYSPSAEPATPKMTWTPGMKKLSLESPGLGNIQIQSVGTPMLFPGRLEYGVPDLLQMIDSDACSVNHMSGKITTFEAGELTDSNVTDFALHLSEDFCCQQQRMASKIPVDENIEKDIPSSRYDHRTPPMGMERVQRKARYSKRMPSEMERTVREVQKRKSRERSAAMRERRKAIIEKNSTADTTETLKRKVQRCGRRTRSMIKACKDLGLGKTDEEINALFSSNSER